MGIFEECTEPSGVNPKGSKVNSILASLEKKDRESLLAALQEVSISPEKIATVLQNRGIDVGRSAIKLWRVANIKKDA